MPANDQWWRTAVIYQVYPRSFADSNGDGVGDINGIRSRLAHLAALGVDALWINPWYPSPMVDGGYDVVRYDDIEPLFGTLADAEALISEAHAAGLRVLLDIVPNHTSDQHEWFQAALASEPGSDWRGRYIFRDGLGINGNEPPNNWLSCFGGPAWTRVVEADGQPGQWYLHLFDPTQPDRNWLHPAVPADAEAVLRFWFDRGVDGFRIDVAHSLFKADGLPDVGAGNWLLGEMREHPHWDQEPVHDVYRRWREIGDSYDPPRVFVAEAWLPHLDRLVRYVRSDELHTSFNFPFLRAAWRTDSLRDVIDRSIALHASVGAPPTWVLSNHDVMRHASRLARLDTRDRGDQLREFIADEADHQLGHARARAMLLLMLALPGSCYLYQGEELGLREVEDLPHDALCDPTWQRSGYTDPGRDGCRVPLPWNSDQPSFGFSPPVSDPPWLPQPAWFGDYAVDCLERDESSMLHLYRRALHTRRGLVDDAREDFEWLAAPPGVLWMRRGRAFECIVNVSGAPLRLPDGVTLLSSTVADPQVLEPNAAVWRSVAAER
jgi:alpha-glucosidase